MHYFKIRLYPQDPNYGSAIIFEQVPAKDKDYAREWGKEMAARMGIILEGEPYVDWLATIKG